MIPGLPLSLPPVPVLIVTWRRAVALDPDGPCRPLSFPAAAQLARGTQPLVCHAPAVAARLGIERFESYDLLELFAFVRPARFCLPTPRGLAVALGLPLPVEPEDEAEALRVAALRLLERLARAAQQAHPRGLGETQDLAGMMAHGGWAWGPLVLEALGGSSRRGGRNAAAQLCERLPDWDDRPADPPETSIPVDPEEARQRLAEMLGPEAEPRPGQADYAAAVSQAFQPRAAPETPWLVLAEAGTGTGKTLGYLAPASLWAERNGAPVWISTHTRTLQRQLDGELDRLFSDPSEKARKVVIRKGRENYLCLLNFEEAVRQDQHRSAPAIGLVARWIRATRDGAMIGGDFPGWLVEVLGRPVTLGLTDRRGECVFAACPHYRKCFIERAIRRARHAEIVIANHALVMIRAALGEGDETGLPTRLVFDEGHHLFDVADSTFATHLSGQEGVEMRRWLLGPENEDGRSRARGLRLRTEDLIGTDELALTALGAALTAARALPAPGWMIRLGLDEPQGAAERFLALVRRQVLARAHRTARPYGLECSVRPPLDGLTEAATVFAAALAQLEQALKSLAQRLADLLDEQADSLDSASRSRIDSVRRGIKHRVLLPLAVWRDMLDGLITPPARPPQKPPSHFDWLGLERSDGQERDVGLHRAWIDPTQPFAQTVMAPAHGVVITSATLRDGADQTEAEWRAAEGRTGSRHLPARPLWSSVASPFDYPARTRVLIVTDVRKEAIEQVAAAYRVLFLAAGGGGLGLFTAISRLREVHRRIAAPLEAAGLPLLAQHVDGMDPATLVEIFRAEESSCLLGTDALRDGMDVPGRALRLIVFDRVPWPRPDLLHRARRACFGGRAYDERLTRLRLKQAFGRLIRRAGDQGVFILLDPTMGPELFEAFPPGVIPRRLGLAQAVRETAAVLAPSRSRDNS